MTSLIPNELLSDDEETSHQDATIQLMKDAHIKNRSKEKECKSAKDFMTMVQYQVPLNKLYKVVSSC